MFPLDPLLRRALKYGRLRVNSLDGKSCVFGQADAPLSAAITLHDPKLVWQLAWNPAFYTGEAYADGRLAIEEGTILTLVGTLLRNSLERSTSRAARMIGRFHDWLNLPAVINRVDRARRNVHHHYDLSGELFGLFLDSDWQYSCAYFRNGDEDLDTAQLAKKQHIAAKLDIRPGQHILDIGSGWGGLALYLASHYPVRVTGLTLSSEQLARATERAREMGLQDRVTFKLMDYRLESGAYDRIVSVGMFEHVGRPHYDAFFRKVKSLLKPDGSALIHTIGCQTPPGPINPWLRRNIFPGAYLPSLSQLVPIFENRLLWLTDMENLRLHYAETLAAWNRRFQANRAHVAELYDERFCRMWEFYLQACEAAFRWGGLTVFQLQLTRTIDAVPLTRDYIAMEEARLAAAETAAPRIDRPDGDGETAHL